MHSSYDDSKLKNKKKIIVCCLPVAGQENPYQYLMMEGLRQDNRLDIRHGVDGKLFVALRTWFKHRPDFIHYDWNYRYFLRRYKYLSYVNALIFVLELMFVRYILDCRIVWTLHNIQSHEKLQSDLEQYVQRSFAHLCDWIRVFWPSTIERAVKYLDINPDRFRILPMGNYLDYYPNEVKRCDRKIDLEVEEDAFVLLYFGQIRPYKGILEFIQTFREIANSDWKLLIVGPALDIDYAENIKMQVSEDSRVLMIDQYITNNRIQYYFNACKVVVLPFDNIENSSSVVLAMGFGKPILAPNKGVLSELLKQQLTLLYSSGKLKESLNNLGNYSLEELSKIGQSNLERAMTFQWKDFAHFFLDK